jgi:8-oxo-dGTP pyrophosphatase MutT (NUDIX family)
MSRMADRASAIIISKRHVLLIHRIRARRDFYVFPGGGIEEGESAAEACAREVLEETGLRTAWLEPAFDHPTPTALAHYFFVEVHPGAALLGGPEALKQAPDNRYVLQWVPLAQVGALNLQPAPVRDALALVSAEGGPVREARDLALRRDRLQALLNPSARSA